MFQAFEHISSALRPRTAATPGVLKTTLLLVAPVALVGVLLKIHRIALYPGELPLLGALRLLSGELLAYTGFLLIALALLSLSSRLELPRLAMIIIQSVTVATLLVGMLTHGYYLTTGFTLSFELFTFSLARADEVVAIIGSEATGLATLAMVSVTAAVLFLPWLFRPVESDPSPRPRLRKLLWVGAVQSVLGVALILLSLVANGRNQDRNFYREPMVALAAAGIYAGLNPAPYQGVATEPRPVGPGELNAGPEAGKLNLVIVLLESTRALSTTPYNPQLGTTPFLDQLATESLLVERAYAIVPHTSKALVSVLCGFEPAVTVDIVASRGGGMTGRCLASLLSDHGYDTAYFQAPKQSFERRKKLVENMGFEGFWSGDMSKQEGMEKINYFGYEDAVMLEPSREWLRNEAREPFFAAYLSTATHHPYGVPSSYEPQDYAKSPTLNKYLNTIRYTDQILQKIVDQYKEAGLWDRTVFIVLGDHGEALGEHGLRSHDNVMYEEGLRIPMLIRSPLHEPDTIPGPLNQLAIVPTAIDLLGFEAPPGSYAGASVLRRPSEPALFARCYQSDRCAATIRGDKKLIYLFGDRPAILFDLAADPDEKHNIASRHRDLVEQWSHETADWKIALRQTHKDSRARLMQKYVKESPQQVEHPMNVVFGGLVELRGFSLPKDKVRGDKRLKIHYFFHVLKEIPPRYRLRLRGTALGQNRVFDHVPVRGLYPLREWQSGDYVEDVQSFKIKDSWGAEKLDLCLELIDENERPLPVTGEQGGTCVPLASIKVVPAKK